MVRTRDAQVETLKWEQSVSMASMKGKIEGQRKWAKQRRKKWKWSSSDQQSVVHVIIACDLIECLWRRSTTKIQILMILSICEQCLSIEKYYFDRNHSWRGNNKMKHFYPLRSYRKFIPSSSSLWLSIRFVRRINSKVDDKIKRRKNYVNETKPIISKTMSSTN